MRYGSRSLQLHLSLPETPLPTKHIKALLVPSPRARLRIVTCESDFFINGRFSADLATPDTIDSDPAPLIECMHHQRAHMSGPFDEPAESFAKEQQALPLPMGVGVGENDTGGGGVVESRRGGRVGALQFRAPARVSSTLVARVVTPTPVETSSTTAVRMLSPRLPCQGRRFL